MFHATDKRLFTGLLFLLLTMAFPLEGMAVTFQAVSTDSPGTGFYDETPLSETEKFLLRADGINSETLGEARRSAFGAALRTLGSLLVGDNTIRVEASFESLPWSPEGGTIASARPAIFLYVEHVEPQGRGGEGFFIPIALAETIFGEELNGATEADIIITFNENVSFHYGLPASFSFPSYDSNLFLTATHEIIHGLGFFEFITDDGSFSSVELEPGRVVRGVSGYDINLYSEEEDELLIYLSDSARLRAITSGTPSQLLWDGTSDGLNDYSCAQLAGEELLLLDQVLPSALDSTGRPRLYAPSPWEDGSSVSHLAPETDDLMIPADRPLVYVHFSLPMLKDMGWELNRENVERFLPTGILGDCTVAADGEPEPEPCPDGQMRDDTGMCLAPVCTGDQTLNPAGDMCLAPVCTGDQTLNPAGDMCLAPVCTGDQTLNPAGDMCLAPVCTGDQTLNQAGDMCLAPVCTGDQTLNPAGDMCLAPVCTGDQTLNPAGDMCLAPVCTGDQTLNPAGDMCLAPVCTGDQTLNQAGDMCLAPVCTGDQTLNPAGDMCLAPVCTGDQTLNPAGDMCVPQPEPPPVNPGSSGDSGGGCAIAEAQNATQNTIFINLIIAIGALFFAVCRAGKGNRRGRVLIPG